MAHPSCRIKTVEMLQPLIEGAGTLILNGDTAEQRHPELRSQGREMFDSLMKLCNENGTDPVVLRGNHDPKLAELDCLDLPEASVFLTHGDVLFPLISPWNPKVWPVSDQIQAIRADVGEEKMACDLEAALDATHQSRFLASGDEEEFRAKRFKNLRAIKKLAWPPRRPIEILKCWMQTPGLAEEFVRDHRPESRFFIFGHTHRPGIWERGEKVLINTGGFLSLGSAQMVEILEDQLSVFAVDESGKTFSKGKRKFFEEFCE